MITTDISYRGPPELIVYMVKIRAGFAVIDGITQFGVISLDLPVIIAMGDIWGGGGVVHMGGGFIWGGGGSYYLKRGVRKKGGS